MPHDQQKPQRSNGPTAVEMLSFFYTALCTHAFCVTPLTRRCMGTRCPGIAALYALLLLYLMACQDRIFLFYLAIWLVVLAFRRLETLALTWKGATIHSQFVGHPWLAMRFTGNYGLAVWLVEPLICVSAGIVLLLFSKPLAVFVAAAGPSLILKSAMEKAIVQRRLQSVGDARIEAEYYNNAVNR